MKHWLVALQSRFVQFKYRGESDGCSLKLNFSIHSRTSLQLVGDLVAGRGRGILFRRFFRDPIRRRPLFASTFTGRWRVPTPQLSRWLEGPLHDQAVPVHLKSDVPVLVAVPILWSCLSSLAWSAPETSGSKWASSSALETHCLTRLRFNERFKPLSSNLQDKN